MGTASMAYATFHFNLIRPIITQAPWPSPVGIGAFLSTLDWKAVVLAFVCVTGAFLICYPFIKIYDKKLYTQELKTTN